MDRYCLACGEKIEECTCAWRKILDEEIQKEEKETADPSD